MGSTQPWGGREPRKWQVEALDAVESSLRGSSDPIVVHAVMGSGKSLVISELVRQHGPEDPTHRVVVTTPQLFLVDQLHASIEACCGPVVGRYNGHEKTTSTPVIVCCNASAPKLATAMTRKDLKCSLWIADEVHRTETEGLHRARRDLHPHQAVGFSATPFRANALEHLRLWNRQVYSYGPRRALDEKCIVPWRVVSAMPAEDLDIQCAEWIAEAEGPGVANASNIEEAEAFAELLQCCEIRAHAIHSRLNEEEHGELLADLKQGRIRCLVHVSMLQEGVDLPWLRWMCLRRPVRSRVRFIQEVGRALRASEGKTVATFFDPHNLFRKFQLTYHAVLGGETVEAVELPLGQTRRAPVPAEEEWYVTIGKIFRTLFRWIWRRFRRVPKLTSGS